MAIKLGTVAAIGFPEFPPAPWLACFRQLGCTVVQAYRNANLQISVQQMRDAIAAGGMPCDSLHGIFGETFDPSCPQEPARRFAVDTYKAEGDLALALGGSLVVVHCSTVRKEGVGTAERGLRLRQLRKSIAELGDHGRRIGVRYAFENLPQYHPVGSDVAELAGILAELGAPNTGMCFDSGHANMVGNPAAAVRRTAGQMIYVHLSDNSGQADEHEMLTYGSIDHLELARALHEAAYSGTMMLEVFYPIERLKQVVADGCAQRLSRIVALAEGRDQ